VAVEVAYDDKQDFFARLEQENPYVDGDNTTNDVRDDTMLHEINDLIFLFAFMLHALTLFYSVYRTRTAPSTSDSLL